MYDEIKRFWDKFEIETEKDANNKYTELIAAKDKQLTEKGFKNGENPVENPGEARNKAGGERADNNIFEDGGRQMTDPREEELEGKRA